MSSALVLGPKFWFASVEMWGSVVCLRATVQDVAPLGSRVEKLLRSVQKIRSLRNRCLWLMLTANGFVDFSIALACKLNISRYGIAACANRILWPRADKAVFKLSCHDRVVSSGRSVFT